MLKELENMVYDKKSNVETIKPLICSKCNKTVGFISMSTPDEYINNYICLKCNPRKLD